MKSFENQWKERFGKFAKQYEADYLVSGWSEDGLLRRLSMFQRLFKKHGPHARARILDLGCGAGTYVRFLAGLGYKVVGLDYSLHSIKRALASDAEKSGNYIEAEAYNLPFQNECFDMVVSIGVLQTLSCPEKALDEIVRVLKPEGLVMMDFLNAHEIVSLVKSVIELMRGRRARVRTYSQFLVKSWLEKRDIGIIKRSGVYLPPRRISWIGRIFDNKGVINLLEYFPGLSQAVAHAFMLVGKKNLN